MSVPYRYSVLDLVWLQFEFYFVDTSVMMAGMQRVNSGHSCTLLRDRGSDSLLLGSATSNACILAQASWHLWLVLVSEVTLQLRALLPPGLLARISYFHVCRLWCVCVVLPNI